jgi:hypothetical protein
MNERKIIEFMEKLSGEKIPASDADTPSEEKVLEEFWNQNLSLPLSDTTSESECDRFREKLQAYQEGLLNNPNIADAKGSIFRRPRNRWQLYVSAAAAVLMLALGIDQINYRTTLKTRQMNSEIGELKELLALTLIRQNTATDRIDGVVWASDLKNPEPLLMEELVRMLTDDPSVNVRLAALNSLAPFSENPEIRKSLIQAIGRQDSSLITLNICKILIKHPRPEEYPVLIQQLEDSGLGADYLERFRKTLKPQI